MAPSQLQQPLLQEAEGAVAEAAQATPSPINTAPGPSPLKSEEELIKKKMKMSNTASQKKADASLEAMRNAAKLAAETPMAAESPEVRVSLFGGTPRAGGNRAVLETARTLHLKEEERRNNRNFWLSIVFQVVLSLSCFALASWLFFDQHLGESMRIKGFPVDRWLIAIAAVAPIYCVSRVLSSLLLMLSEFIFEHHQQVHYVILGLWWPLTRFLSAVGLYVLVKVLEMGLPENQAKHDHDDSGDHSLWADAGGDAKPDPTKAADGADKEPQRLFVDSICLCFLIFSAVSLLSKLGCRLLSMRVTGATLFDKLKATVDQEQVLSRLMKPPGNDDLDPALSRVQMLAKQRDIPPAAVLTYLKDLHRLSLSAPTKGHESFAEQLTRLTKSFEHMEEEELDQYAHHAAEFLWCTARPDPAVPKIVQADFEAILADKEDAKFAYELFDLDGDGFVLETEVHERFEEIYRHRRNIANTLMDTNDIINTLEALIGGIMHVIAVFAYLAIFNVNVQHLLISFSSVAVAFAFVFGNSLREVYESVVWLFVVNPYDEGDCLWYSNTFATVHKFGLLNTQLVLTNGSMVWVPNQTLIGTGVTNLSRSKPVAVYMEVEVDASVTPAAVADLAKKMKATAASDDTLFDPTFDVGAHIQNVISPLKYQVEMCYKTTTTMMQYSRYCEARAMMNETIGAWIEEHGVSFSAPYQQAFTNMITDNSPR